jgi:hypothetical protein
MLARALTSFLLAASATAQLVDPEISELRVLPSPNDHQVIEVIGFHPFQTTGHHLVLGTTSIALPSVAVPSLGVLVIHLGVAGVNTPTDVYLPSAPPLALASAVAWFRTAPSANPADLIDYVCWGGFVGPHAATAVFAGRWTATPLTAQLPAAVGSSLANRRFTRNTGNLVGPDAWYGDSTPTFGSENDPAMTWAHAIGCVNANAPGIYGVFGTEPGPWLGEPASISISPVTSFALVVLGTTAMPPVHLDVIGMPFCFANITIESTVLVPQAQPYTLFTYTVPVNPLFVGFEFYMQAFVPEIPAVNPMGARVTNSIKAHVGSR